MNSSLKRMKKKEQLCLKHEYYEKGCGACEYDEKKILHTRLKNRFRGNQSENDQRMKEPNVDIKSIVIAVGFILLVFGCGVIIGGKL